MWERGNRGGFGQDLIFGNIKLMFLQVDCPTKKTQQKVYQQNGGGVVRRLCGWPSSRIVRVSRASGGKDRHSKVLTSKGLRDRRVRLSVSTAIQFYDLQDRLGYDQPSKAVEWLIKAASSSIAELPSLNPSFSGAEGYNHHHHLINRHHKQLSDEKKSTGNDTEFEDPNDQNNHLNPQKKAVGRGGAGNERKPKKESTRCRWM
ncbi:hypothetical protein L2E82_19107 [Cichorium intybus]|uniref:Uncharacterized protein n=1 Tax=Cichorium intybus TaxID=13427 RepID=A0ACB9FBB8_CICIN|nr:hypothetical protein L2E82_19107 [Cichorium intybus]